MFNIEVRSFYLDFDSSSRIVLFAFVGIVSMVNFLLGMKIYFLVLIRFQQTERWVIWMMALGSLLIAFFSYLLTYYLNV